MKSQPQISLEVTNLIKEGLALHNVGEINEAKLLYEQVLRSDPNHFDALQLLGTAYAQQNNWEISLEYLDRALQNNNTNAALLNNRGFVLKALKKFDQALDSYNKALQLNPDYADALNNRGNLFLDQGRFDEALRNYDQALEIKKDYAEVMYNSGIALHKLGRYEEAIESYSGAVRSKPDYAEAFFNKGNSQLALKRFNDAIESYKIVLRIKPDYDFLPGLIQYARMFICDWRDLEARLKHLNISIRNNELTSPPFQILGLLDDPELQKKCSIAYSEKKYPDLSKKYKTPTILDKTKPRIGYFSADFHDHATLHLMMDVFKSHDHSKFDFYAFSFGPEKVDAWSSEVKKLFTQFINVQNQSDENVAEHARNLGIDIAIDLKGHTEDSRPGIFSHRAAPIQINYLGYPGTMGAKYIDYIIADRVVIPEDSQYFYTEKVLYLPNCYQPNMKERVISERKFSRKDFHLPEDGVVFCSFNNSYKITPNIFRIWIDVLKEVKNSVLWIYLTNQTGRENLKQVAQNLGVDSCRIVFADNLPIEEHLKRLALADIFLDTFPCNAHTTASDAIRMGVPLITLAGESFASRVAASILTAVDMTDLITTNIDEYKNLAIRLATDSDRLKKLKTKVIKNKQLLSLYDSVIYTRNLEKIYSQILVKTF